MNSESRDDDSQDTAEFCSQVAHELRTPLMLLRLRLENAPPGTPPEFVDGLREEVAKLSRFVEYSLLIARIGQGALQPRQEPVRLGSLLRELVDRHRPLAGTRGLELTSGIACDPETSADPDLLRHVLFALMENAVRYAHRRLHVTCADTSPIRVEIGNDRDPGTMAPGGLGLGLRLVHDICAACAWEFESHAGPNDFHASIRILR